MPTHPYSHPEESIEDATANLQQVRDAAAECRRMLSGAKIGTTAKAVVEQTSWGKPDSVNRITTKYGVSEQWVYEANNSYLYFTNGKLSGIQN